MGKILVNGHDANTITNNEFATCDLSRNDAKFHETKVSAKNSL